jgi:hypothetical protein
MRVVTIARKPIAAAGVVLGCVTHQTGALNIGPCRVAYLSPSDRTESVGHGQFETERGVGNAFPHHKEKWGEWISNPGGRWPANLMLVHASACELVGTRQVSTGTAHRAQSGGKNIFSDQKKPKLSNMSYGEDGVEVVPDWRCVEGCPVAELDRQSGQLQSGAGTVKRASASNREGNRSASFGPESRKSGEPQIFYGDRGGASRFFKQFQAHLAPESGS